MYCSEMSIKFALHTALVKNKSKGFELVRFLFCGSTSGPSKLFIFAVEPT